MRAWGSVVSALALALAGAASLGGCRACMPDLSKDDVPPDGTYVGDMTATYWDRDGGAKQPTFPVPNLKVALRQVGRQYDHSSVEISLLGCTVKGEGSLSQWSLADQPCTIDIPGLGPVAVKMMGGFERRPRSPLEPVSEIYVSLSAENEKYPQLHFSFAAKAEKARDTVKTR